MRCNQCLSFRDRFWVTIFSGHFYLDVRISTTLTRHLQPLDIFTATLFGGYHAKYCIQCHTEYYVTVVIFLMTLLMNKFTSIVMDEWNLDEARVNHRNKV